MLAWAAILPLVLAGTTRANYELAVRSEARASVDTAAQTFSLIDLTPRAGLRLNGESLYFNIAYLPRIALMSGLSQTVPQLMHRGELGLELALTPGRRLFLKQDGGYGMREFTLLGAATSATNPSSPGTGTTTTPTPGNLPTPVNNQRIIGFAPYVQSSSRAGMVMEITRLWTLIADGGYEISGGADPATRAALPLQRGPRFDGLLSYLASAKDTLITTVSGSDAVFSNGRRTSLLIGDERWRRVLGRAGFGELRLGVSAQRQQTENGTVAVATLPVGGIAFDSNATLDAKPVALRLELNVVPFIDPYVAVVYQRIEANALFNWRLGALTLVGRGSAAYALTGFERRGQTLVTLDAGGLYLIDRQTVQLEAGVRGAFQYGALVTTPTWAVGGYIALGFAQIGAL